MFAPARYWLVTLALLGLASAPASGQPAAPAGFTQPAPELAPHLHQWRDTCNVYVLQKGDEALLIGLGDGSVLEALPRLGVRRSTRLLLNDHHREQSQGFARLDRKVTEVAAPAAERAFFEQPHDFRKWFPKLGDPFTVYGASYVRPPRAPLVIDQPLEPGAKLRWGEDEIRCLATPGHAPGGMTFVLSRGGKAIAFPGGLIHAGAKLSNWYDSEWDYGFAKGLDTLITSVAALRAEPLELLLPAHGPAIAKPSAELAAYHDKLTAFRASYVRGYPVFNSTEAERDPLSQPTAVPLISRVTPHLYKLSHKTQGKNFAILISDRGRGLVLDCGLFPEAMLDEIVLGLRTHLGLKQIDAFWISHMHGDHFLLGPALKKKYGAEAWTLDRIADKCEHPRRYDYAALVSAYGDGFDGMQIEKRFRDGESVNWEGYKIQVDWMPGQTEFGCCLWLEVDGKRVAFTGDNLFGSPADPKQNGHEAVVARNSSIFEEGYLRGSKYLRDLRPDIVMGSHSYCMPEPAAFLQRYHQWSQEIIAHYRGLLPDADYEYGYDPYWVSAYPYRTDLSTADEQEVQVTVRNFRARPQRHRIELKPPPGVTAEPRVLEGEVAAESRQAFPVRLRVDRTHAAARTPGPQQVVFDITLDGQRWGERFDFLVRTAAEAAAR